MPNNVTIQAREAYQTAVQKYGRTVDPMLNDIPKSLAYAHIVSVNPDLLAEPPLSWDQRKGFMRVPHAAAVNANIAWTDIESLDRNAYAWCWELNDSGAELYKRNKSYFASPTEDFWKCVYTQHILGPLEFAHMWKLRNPHTTSQFDAVCYAVMSWKKRLGLWTYPRLVKTVTVDLPSTFALATNNGIITSKGYGIRPVLTAGRTRQIFLGK